MEGHARIKSMAILVPVAQASPVPTANMKSMSVTPSPVSTGVSVRMPWSPSAALAPKDILAIGARYKQLKMLGIYCKKF